MTVTTPLGPDVLLLVAFSGHEAISQLFSFELDLAAEDQSKVIFEKLLGHKVTINLTLPGGQKRHFNGICTSLSQGMRGIEHTTTFQMEVSPHLWLLTRRSRSRIFQNLSIPEILKSVLDIPDVVYELEGTFHPRTYCVQYRETDFHFASRLMEEEGIYYYFKHKADSHQMVVSNKAAFPELQPGELTLQQAEGTFVQEERIIGWQKRQQLRSVKVALRDHHFQVPRMSLEAEHEIQDDVKVGKVTHKLKIGESENLEIYDWPGAYSHRFDAIDRGGADRPDELQRLLKDNARTAKIRMEQEAAEAIVVQGVSRYRQLASGHTFTLKEQVVVPYDGSASHDGKYVLTSVSHTGRMSGSFRSGDVQELHYDNSFTGIPAALHYRPQRITPRPVVMGTQTAVVVGPKGEQIHCDKHGRVKVQFHWDREGKHDAASSCWIRVTQPWADKGFGAICLPRAGQEVVVAFEEGDPDRPLILGSVYNADNPPPFKLPECRMFSGIKTNSVNGNPAKNFSGLAFDDTKGSEHAALYAEKDLLLNAENSHVHYVGNYQHTKVGNTSLTVVGSLPGLGGGGGGSGGGGQGASGTTIEGDTVQDGQITNIATPPSPDHWDVSGDVGPPTIGFGGTTILGINSQDTVGFMHQITFLQATQIVIDPFNCWGYFPKTPDPGAMFAPPAAGPPGLPIGGNQQLYWGTNYQSVCGPNVSYSYAGQMSLTGVPGPTTVVMAKLIPILCFLYEASYLSMGTNFQPAPNIIALSFSAALIACNAALLTAQIADYIATQSEAVMALTQANVKLATLYASAGSPTVVTQINQLTADTVLSFNQPELAKKVPLQVTDPVHSINFINGDSLTYAQNFHLFAWQPAKSTNQTSTIYINACGKVGTGGGYVLIGATQQVALSSGAAYIGLVNTAPPATPPTGGDITLQCGMTGNINITRVYPIVPGQVQSIQMSPASMQVQGGLGMVTLSAGGPSPAGASILLQPFGFISLTVPGFYLNVSQAGILMGSQDEQNTIWITKAGIIINATSLISNAKLVVHT